MAGPKQELKDSLGKELKDWLSPKKANLDEQIDSHGMPVRRRSEPQTQSSHRDTESATTNNKGQGHPDSVSDDLPRNNQSNSILNNNQRGGEPPQKPSLAGKIIKAPFKLALGFASIPLKAAWAVTKAVTKPVWAVTKPVVVTGGLIFGGLWFSSPAEDGAVTEQKEKLEEILEHNISVGDDNDYKECALDGVVDAYGETLGLGLKERDTFNKVLSANMRNQFSVCVEAYNQASVDAQGHKAVTPPFSLQEEKNIGAVINKLPIRVLGD